MSLRIEEVTEGVPSEVSLVTVNRKLEAFVEIVMKKLIIQQSEIKKLKERVKTLEKGG